MRQLSFLVFSIFFLPLVAFAECSSSGTTVVYINGINTSLHDANADLSSLQNQFTKSHSQISELKFLNGYNQTRGEVIDVWKLTSQMLAWDPSSWNEDTNGDTILNQLHSELSTQKVVLVGYSQGSFYANETYKYITTHGLSASSVANFDVGTPASYVAGNGEHLTSANDVEIMRAARLAKSAGLAKPLPANITIPTTNDVTGHQFADTYLAGAGDQIINELSWDINGLAPTFNSNIHDCFIPPSDSLVHKTAVRINGAGTLFGTLAYGLGAGTYAGTVTAVDSAMNVLAQVTSDIQVAIGGIHGLAHANQPQYEGTNLKVENALYGKNDTVDGEDLHDLLNGGAAVLADIDVAPSQSLQATNIQLPKPIEPAVPIGPEPGVSPGGGGSAPITNDSNASNESPGAQGSSSGPQSGGVSVQENPAPQDTTDSIAAGDTNVNLQPATAGTATTTASTTPAPSLPKPEQLATMTGFYCNGDTSVLEPGNTYTYRAPNTTCHYLVGFAGRDWTAEALLLKGTVGSSTIVERLNNRGQNYANLDGHGYGLDVEAPGKIFTIVFFQYYNNVGSMFSAYGVGDMLHYLETGIQNDGVTAVVPYEYQSINIVLP